MIYTPLPDLPTSSPHPTHILPTSSPQPTRKLRHRVTLEETDDSQRPVSVPSIKLLLCSNVVIFTWDIEGVSDPETRKHNVETHKAHYGNPEKSGSVYAIPGVLSNTKQNYSIEDGRQEYDIHPHP